MPPRNRPSSSSTPSPSSSPSTSPPAALTKRQRQALRIHRPPLPPVSPPTQTPVLDTEPEPEAIRIRRPVSEERETERASPSKYPTPLPDEEDDDDVLPVPMPSAVPMKIVRSGGADTPEEEEPVYEGGEERNGQDPMADTVLANEVPTGSLIDMQDDDEEEEAVPMPMPMPSPAPARARQSQPARQPQVLRVAEEPLPRPISVPKTHMEDGTSASTRTRKAPSRPPAAAAAAQSHRGQQRAQGERQAHIRAPEVPRVPAPARSALSHTLRSALAASTQAVTSATAYAHNAYSSSNTPYPQSHHVPTTGGGQGSVGAGHGGQSEGDGDGEDDEEIVGARWDEVDVRDGSRSAPTTRRLLTLTYAAGVQVWDVGGVGVREVLNLRIPSPSGTRTKTRTRTSADTLRAVDPAMRASPSFEDDDREKENSEGKGERQNGEGEAGQEMYGPVLGAAVLPLRARHEGGGDGGLEVGILTPHALYVYALSTGRVVARAAFPSASSFPASAARDGRAAKDAYTYGPQAESLGGRGGVREGGREGGGGEEGEVGTPCSFEVAERVVVVTTHSPPALVVLARPSLRILHVFPAAALTVPHPPSPPVSDLPRQSFPSYTAPLSSESVPASQPPGSSAPPQTPTSALHGRLLAFLAPPPSAPLPAHDAAPLATWGRTLGRFFSRSAPTASALAASVFTGGSPPLAGALAAVAGGGGEGGGERWVRVVDLAPLLAGERGRVRDVHAFEAGRAPVGSLAFSRDGTRLFVVRRDGLGAGVWGLRPSPAMAAEEGLPQPTHLYALRRGRTGAVVEALAGARDGRFVALATRRRTVHVFAVNPYGGRADVRSHLGGKVRDAVTGVAAGAVIGSGSGEESTTEVRALVRMRLPPPPHGAEDAPPLSPPAPLAIAFVPASAPVVGLRSPVSPALSSPSSNGGAPSGVQDVLVFDPADGVLSLRRITLTFEAPHTAVAGMQIPLSVSLPAAKAAGRMGMSMSASPPGYAGSYARGAATGGGGAGGAGAGDGAVGELGGKESVVATWSLRRRRGWAEIRRAEAKEVYLAEGRPVKEDWLAQAELSTFTSTPRVLPRAIYLSHQFAFYALGEDYHALIRRYQFVIGGAKIDVRREVEVSAFALGPGSGAGGEAFVEGYGSSSPRAIRRRSRTSSSFDEPLASALAGTHYRDARPPPVLPMLPNGSPASFRSSMPVRAVAGLGDGVAEGLGRLRREMRHQRQKQLARSPPTQPRKGGDDVEASMPLEFDEEDEDFALPAAGGEDVFLRVHADREDDDALSATTSRNGEGSVPSVSTPATSARALEDEERIDLDLDGGAEGEWHGWATEDKLAVEEAERFDDISVVGFLDEEQAAMQAEAARRKGAAARTRTKKRR